jgi:crossover junction endodeoxyribonuclease RuvC
MQIILGIDPGISGGMAILAIDKSSANAVAFAKTTPHDITGLLRHAKISKAYIEAVHSMPKQGVASTFKFGMNYGVWQGLLIGLGIPFERVVPAKWQLAMGCRTRGDKNISKHRAQELFPRLQVTHAIADALLIAEYGRRKEGMFCGLSEKGFEEGYEKKE